MPSNRELSEQARSLAEKLGTKAETLGLNNAALADLVTDLQLRVDEKSALADIRSNPETSALLPETEEASYFLAMGCQLATKRGVLRNGDQVKPADVSDGIAQLDIMVASGFLTKS